MSSPPLPLGLESHPTAGVANRLHSIAIYLLRRARRVDRATGLSPQRLSLLSVLAYGGPKTVSELADVEMVSRPAISKILNALVKLGLVRRERSTSDRRHVLAHVTSKGRKLMEQGRKRRVVAIAKLLEELDERDLVVVDQATRVLSSLRR